MFDHAILAAGFTNSGGSIDVGAVVALVIVVAIVLGILAVFALGRNRKGWIPDRPSTLAGSAGSASGQWAAYMNSLPVDIRFSESPRVTGLGQYSYDERKAGVRALCEGGPKHMQAVSFGTSHPNEECPAEEWGYADRGRFYIYRWNRRRRDHVHIYVFDRDEPDVPKDPGYAGDRRID